MTPDEARELWPDVLAALPRAWREVRELVEVAPPGLVELIADRYAAGCDEFAGDWTTRDPGWCTENAMEELADLVTYFAFRHVLRTATGPRIA